MRDHEPKDGTQGQPPLKAKTGGEQERQHKHADGHPTAHPDVLSDERLAHPANAEPLAELLSQLQHSHGNAYVQRVVGELSDEKSNAESKTEAGPKPENVRSLDAGTRSEMESAFGENFGDVRVHTGKRAEDASAQLGARALTRGRDIYFNAGEYNPATRDGKELLAHELTHVVQQEGGSSSSRSSSLGRVGDSFEQEADEIAALVVRGERAHVEKQGAAPAYQRQGQQTRQAPLPVTQHMHAGILSGGFLQHFGIGFTFSEQGLDYIMDFHMPQGVTFGSADPQGLCRRSQRGAHDVRITVTRPPGQVIHVDISFRRRNEKFVLNLDLPRRDQPPSAQPGGNQPGRP